MAYNSTWLLVRMIIVVFRCSPHAHVLRHDKPVGHDQITTCTVDWADSSVRAFNHLLGETGVGIFGVKALAKALRKGFPQSLDGAPMLLPLENPPLRRTLDQWFDRIGIKPKVLAEFEDSALLKAFARDGVGVFPSPLAIQSEICRHFGVESIGEVPGAQERFYAISVERRLKHPATVAITASARTDLFGS
jgi:LysR family transcriptional regulator, transcriptional activator of nhaA